MKTILTLLSLCASVLPIALAGQALDPAAREKDAWPTHYGDYSGRRYSPLSQINAANVKTLSLAWIHRASAQESANAGAEK